MENMLDITYHQRNMSIQSEKLTVRLSAIHCQREEAIALYFTAIDSSA